MFKKQVEQLKNGGAGPEMMQNRRKEPLFGQVVTARLRVLDDLGRCHGR